MPIPSRYRPGRRERIFAVVLGIVLGSASARADLVHVDSVWPSVGPGSDHSLAAPGLVELDVAREPQARTRVPVAPAPLSATPAVSLGFGGVDGTSKDGLLHKPPDTHIAVGPGTGAAGRVVMVTNSGLQVWDKAGASIAGPTPLDTFLGTAVGAAFDPKVLYDQHAGRFFVVVLDGKTPNPGGTGNLHVAVSASSAPTNLTTDWTMLAGSALTNVDGVETFFDYPGIGADGAALFVTGNLFDVGGVFRGAKIRVFDKSAVSGLLAGVYAFVDIDIDGAMVPGVSTIQPAHVHGATDSGNFYLVNRIGFSTYRLWEIAGHPAAPSVVGNAPRVWAAGLQTGFFAPQAGTPVVLDPVSARVMSAVYRAGHVWLALSSDADFDNTTEVFWAKIATNSGAPAAPVVADSGFIDGSSGEEWTFVPALNVNQAGDVTVTYTESFSDQFPEMRYASRAAADPPGTFQPSAVAAVSPGFYDAFGAGIGERWGDYAATVVDPDDDTTFWIASETVLSSGVDTSIWNTFVARLGPVLPGPPPPAPAAPENHGGLTLFDVTGQCNGTLPTGLLGPIWVASSPDAQNVYVASFSSQGSFNLTFRRHAVTGRLEPVQILKHDSAGPPDGLSRSRDGVVSPDGLHLYRTADFSDVPGTNGEVSVFRRTPTTGELALVQIVGVGAPPPGLSAPTSLQISPDGAHVYVALQGENEVVVFARNPATGELTTIQEMFDDGAGGTGDGLDRVSGIVVSPDGSHLYATAEREDELGVFLRDTVTGELAFLDVAQEGIGGVLGLREPESMTISPDGAHVYVTSRAYNTLALFSRDATMGALTFVEVLSSAVGLKSPTKPRVSPDGRHVYVVGESAVHVFLREASTGRLTPLGNQSDGFGDCPPEPRQVAVSPDGSQVYATGDFGLVTYTRDACGSGLVAGDEQCDDGNVAGGDGCSADCTLEPCPPLPLTGCRSTTASAASAVTLKEKAGFAGDGVTWKWKGELTTAADLGDPTTIATYALCLYDASSEPQPLRTFAQPAGGLCSGKPCWLFPSVGRLKYKDSKLRTPDGIVQATMQAGPDGRAKLGVKGKGALVRLPPLPLAPPVRAQLVNTETGVCWDAVYGTPSRNDAFQFKAKSD